MKKINENKVNKLVELYAPNTPDGHKFVNMHLVMDTDYVPGYPKMNDVYTAKSIPAYTRSHSDGHERYAKKPGESFSPAGQTRRVGYKIDHGYMPGEDAAAYFPHGSKYVNEAKNRIGFLGLNHSAAHKQHAEMFDSVVKQHGLQRNWYEHEFAGNHSFGVEGGHPKTGGIYIDSAIHPIDHNKIIVSNSALPDGTPEDEKNFKKFSEAKKHINGLVSRNLPHFKNNPTQPVPTGNILNEARDIQWHYDHPETGKKTTGTELPNQHRDTTIRKVKNDIDGKTHFVDKRTNMMVIPKRIMDRTVNESINYQKRHPVNSRVTVAIPNNDNRVKFGDYHNGNVLKHHSNGMTTVRLDSGAKFNVSSTSLDHEEVNEDSLKEGLFGSSVYHVVKVPHDKTKATEIWGTTKNERTAYTVAIKANKDRETEDHYFRVMKNGKQTVIKETYYHVFSHSGGSHYVHKSTVVNPRQAREILKVENEKTGTPHIIVASDDPNPKKKLTRQQFHETYLHEAGLSVTTKPLSSYKKGVDLRTGNGSNNAVSKSVSMAKKALDDKKKIDEGWWRTAGGAALGYAAFGVPGALVGGGIGAVADAKAGLENETRKNNMEIGHALDAQKNLKSGDRVSYRWGKNQTGRIKRHDSFMTHVDADNGETHLVNSSILKKLAEELSDDAKKKGWRYTISQDVLDAEKSRRKTNMFDIGRFGRSGKEKASTFFARQRSQEEDEGHRFLNDPEHRRSILSQLGLVGRRGPKGEETYVYKKKQ